MYTTIESIVNAEACSGKERAELCSGAHEYITNTANAMEDRIQALQALDGLHGCTDTITGRDVIEYCYE